MVHTLRRLGRTAIRQGDPDRAQQLFDQANALDNEPNDTMGLAIMLHDLGDLAYAQGNYARAADLWRQALAQREELEDRQGIAQTHWCLGRAALGRRDLAEAQQRLSVSLRLCAELADTRGMIDSLIGLSIVAARQGMPLQAARLAGAEEALREGLSASAPAVDQPALQAALEAARAHVDRLSWTAAWLAGRTMSIDQLIAELDAAPSPALSLPA
jgi:tetratricopeptide (TPR) repeat protein